MKMEGVGVEKMEGLGKSERELGVVGLVQDVVNGTANAYYAAVAEHLALKYRLPVPPWTADSRRFLNRPFFPCGLESLKATLLMESPVAFRRRMIFVDADPLYRPRRDTPSFGT